MAMQTQAAPVDRDARIRELGAFPLLEALFGRRSRRFGLGMRIPDGPLAYTSPHEPMSLSDLEHVILIMCATGISGWNTGIEHTTVGNPDKGCNYPLRLTGRTNASAAGIATGELIITDDRGTFITQFRDLDPHRMPVVKEVGDFEQLIKHVLDHCVQLSPDRVQLPRAFPHYSPHNLWNANQPGTTLFIPVIDMTQQFLDFLMIYLSFGVMFWDPIHDRPCGDMDRFVELGLLNRDKRASFVDFEQYCLATGAIEQGLMCQNVVLTLQAMGLGGWMFTGINPPSLLGAYSDDGVPALGFRFTRQSGWSQPNPVGLDDYFEGLCPPYYPDMRAAVERFIEIKFGAGGTFDPGRPGPYRQNRQVKSRIERHSPEHIDMVCEVAQYLFDSFGKFPATIPSIYVRTYAQAQHLDMEFYDQFYAGETYLESHRTHMEHWHPS